MLGVLYASVDGAGKEEVLKRSVAALLDGVDEKSTPKVLWSMYFEQNSTNSSHTTTDVGKDGQILVLPENPFDLTFNDAVLDKVKAVWEKITGAEGSEFLVFDERENSLNEDDDDDVNENQES